MSNRRPNEPFDLYYLKVEKRQVPCLTTPTLEYHGVYMLTFILEGNGLCQVDSALYRFAPGDVLMVRPNEACCCFGTDHQSYTAFEMRFDESALAPFKEGDALRGPLLLPWNVREPFVHKRSLGVSERRTLDVFAQQMLALAVPNHPLTEPCRRTLLSGLFCAALAFLLDIYGLKSGAESDDKPKDHMVARAIQYINMNYDKDLTLDSIARYLYVNPSYLSHVFKRETGEPLIVYINKRRIQQARYYLTNTNLRVTRIAALVGFNSASYFNVVFKTYEGCAPQAYRKLAGRTEAED